MRSAEIRNRAGGGGRGGLGRKGKSADEELNGSRATCPPKLLAISCSTSDILEMKIHQMVNGDKRAIVRVAALELDHLRESFNWIGIPV